MSQAVTQPIKAPGNPTVARLQSSLRRQLGVAGSFHSAGGEVLGGGPPFRVVVRTSGKKVASPALVTRLTGGLSGDRHEILWFHCGRAPGSSGRAEPFPNSVPTHCHAEVNDFDRPSSALHEWPNRSASRSWSREPGEHRPLRHWSKNLREPLLSAATLVCRTRLPSPTTGDDKKEAPGERQQGLPPRPHSRNARRSCPATRQAATQSNGRIEKGPASVHIRVGQSDEPREVIGIRIW